jgi:sugar lactone lactonase YvrE
MKNTNLKILIYFALFFYLQTALAQSPVPSGAVLEKLRTGFLQPEGPVWKDGVGLLFSDIQANIIYCWSPVDSSLTTYLNPSNNSNGLTFDLQGRLILTQMSATTRRVARQEPGGTITSLTSTYNGKKYNSPNDLVVKSDGSIFFTDPDFNTPGGLAAREMGFKGVFRISPYGKVYALDSTTFAYNSSQSEPNGICFSPDESKLYVNDSPVGKIYVWDVVNDTIITQKKLLYTIPLGGYADGMKVDPSGNIYCTGPKGIWIVSSAGTYLDSVNMATNPSNCTWGDTDRKTLYITAGNTTNANNTTVGIYRIRLSTTGVNKDRGQNLPNDFELHQNYPNPFNPTTKIEYRIANSGFVKLKVFDTLGREIATLVNEEKPAGKYQVKWDASGMSSGLYSYKLSATSLQDHNKNYSETKKMLLLK